MRSELYFQLSQQLKWLSQTYSLCVIVVNQVTSTLEENIINHPSHSPFNPNSPLFHQYEFQDIDEAEFGEINSSWSHPNDRSKVVPSLGLAWAHCVNARYLIFD